MWCGSHICIICSTTQQKLAAQRRLVGFFFLLILGKKASFVSVPSLLQEKLELSSVEKIQKIVIADKLETPLVKNKYFFKHIITGNMKCFKEKKI